MYSNSDIEDITFMAIDTKFDAIENEDKRKEKTDSKEEENVEIDGEVDLEEELICALSEIKKVKKKNLKQKEQLQKYEEGDHDSKTKISQSLEEIENTIIGIKVQLKEEKSKEEVVRIHPKEK